MSFSLWVKGQAHEKTLIQKKICSTLEDRGPVKVGLPAETMLWACDVAGRQSLVEVWCMKMGKGESPAREVKESALKAWDAILWNVMWSFIWCLVFPFFVPCLLLNALVSFGFISHWTPVTFLLLLSSWNLCLLFLVSCQRCINLSCLFVIFCLPLVFCGLLLFFARRVLSSSTTCVTFLCCPVLSSLAQSSIALSHPRTYR